MMFSKCVWNALMKNSQLPRPKGRGLWSDLQEQLVD
jgi:hypothetical protein